MILFALFPVKIEIEGSRDQERERDRERSREIKGDQDREREREREREYFLRTLCPLFMDGVQLFQGYRATTKRQVTLYH